MRGEVEFTPTDKDQLCKLNVSMHTLCYYPMSPESAIKYYSGKYTLKMRNEECVNIWNHAPRRWVDPK